MASFRIFYQLAKLVEPMETNVSQLCLVAEHIEDMVLESAYIFQTGAF